MKKIKTIFERDWEGDRSRVLDVPVEGTEWVFAGEGTATQKLDGSACLVNDGMLWKRHEVRAGKQTPPGFWPVDVDDMTTKMVGWVPVGDGPEDKWHREAFDREQEHGGLLDGTYELLGPKVQGNPEHVEEHVLMCHADAPVIDDDLLRRTFSGLKTYLLDHDIEGIVFHHDDGRMAKIKARDFGIKRGAR